MDSGRIAKLHSLGEGRVSAESVERCGVSFAALLWTATTDASASARSGTGTGGSRPYHPPIARKSHSIDAGSCPPYGS